MKKIFIGIVLSIMLCLIMQSSPISVKAETLHSFGMAWIDIHGYDELVELYVYTNPPYTYLYNDYGTITLYNQDSPVFFDYQAGYYRSLNTYYTKSVYADGLSSYQPIWNSNFNNYIYIFSNYDDFENDLPSSLQRTDAEKRWDKFYDMYELIWGYRPLPGSFIDTLRELALGDESDDTVIVFPSATPTPTPTPTPSPIPVQTIFVPDGNGNTTIIYQYPDGNGNLTQSPYNPNITNNIEVDCNCDGSSGGGSNPFGSSPQDPYTLLADLNWGNALGAEFSDSPLQVADDSQTTLKGAASEYTSSVEVMSNSFNVLPFKWLTLVGLLGGILILAGLLRTFLGG